MPFNPLFGTLASLWQRLFCAWTSLQGRVHGAQDLRRKVVQRLDHQVGLLECGGGFRDEMVGINDTFYAGRACRAITGNRVFQRESGFRLGAQFLDRGEVGVRIRFATGSFRARDQNRKMSLQRKLAETGFDRIAARGRGIQGQYTLFCGVRNDITSYRVFCVPSILIDPFTALLETG